MAATLSTVKPGLQQVGNLELWGALTSGLLCFKF
jgi:hypothetical protein